jgi:alpha-L-fucosidase 2
MKIRFDIPIQSWDEGAPIGNGLFGAIVWGNERELYLSLDQATLWDERTPPEYHDKSFHFDELLRCIRAEKWDRIVELFESPGARYPWPTKLRACRLILSLPAADRWTHVTLDISTGVIELCSKKGRVEVACDVQRPLLALKSTGLSIRHRLEFPDYRQQVDKNQFTTCGYAGLLSDLAYPAARHGRRGKTEVCVQEIGGGKATVTATQFRKNATGGELFTYVSGPGSPDTMIDESCAAVDGSLRAGFAGIRRESANWWKQFWARSSATISHEAINRHYQLGQYFLGSCSRLGTPPMPLQGVWTADAKTLPPWRGDYHNNLNTQFCYISYLSNNRLDEGRAFLDYMWNIMPKLQDLAKRWFSAPGAFVPLCLSLGGEAISGWAPYSFSLTNGAWVGEMFYRHWKYTLDQDFLRERAYPFCLAQGEFLLHHLKPDPKTGRLVLPMSSSAEIYDATPRSYLPSNSNYDHFLMLKLFRDLEEMSAALGRKSESAQWKRHAKALGPCATSKVPSPDGLIRGEVLALAPGMPLDRSHRHHAHLMGIYPLNILHPENGPREKELVDNSTHQIDLLGTGEWTGYSLSWYAALCARIGRGDAAVSWLERYLDGCVSPNGFHLNGDFKNLGYTVYKYRPFTLEGNFAAVQAVNDMLLQDLNGSIRIGYALPAGIGASFRDLRAERGFLVSAEIDRRGRIGGVVIKSTAGGRCRVANPWKGRAVRVKPGRPSRLTGDILEFDTKPGGEYRLESTAR